MVLLLCAGCAGSGIRNAAAANATNITNSTNVSAPIGTVTTAPLNATTVPELIKELKKDVVMVSYEGTHAEDEFGETDFAFIGSGVIYSSSDGKSYVLTNRHVVDLNYPDMVARTESENITVQTSDGETFTPTERYIAPGTLDLAILVFDNNGSDLDTASVSDTLPQEGDDVLLIGMPEMLNWSISKGIVSGIRPYTSLWFDNGMNFTGIQTDAAMNAGNSGGGMFTMDGRLVGIDAWKEGYFTQGLNFAISVANFSAMKDGFIPYPILAPGEHVQEAEATPPASIGALDLEDCNDTTESAMLSFVLVDQNGFPTNATGQLHITLKDNSTTMYDRTMPISMTDFQSQDGTPYYGIQSFSRDISANDVKPSDQYLGNVTVSLITPSGTLNKTEEVFIPYCFAPAYSDTGDNSDYYSNSGTDNTNGNSGSYNYSGSDLNQVSGLNDINVSSSNNGILVTLTKGGAIYGSDGSPGYEIVLNIANNNKDAKDLDVSSAILVIDHKQYQVDDNSVDTDPYGIGTVYPDASVDHEVDFIDVPSSSGADARLYLVLDDNTDSSDNYDYYGTNTLDYNFTFSS